METPPTLPTLSLTMATCEEPTCSYEALIEKCVTRLCSCITAFTPMLSSIYSPCILMVHYHFSISVSYQGKALVPSELFCICSAGTSPNRRRRPRHRADCLYCIIHIHQKSDIERERWIGGLVEKETTQRWGIPDAIQCSLTSSRLLRILYIQEVDKYPVFTCSTRALKLPNGA